VVRDVTLSYCEQKSYIFDIKNNLLHFIKSCRSRSILNSRVDLSSLKTSIVILFIISGNFLSAQTVLKKDEKQLKSFRENNYEYLEESFWRLRLDSIEKAKKYAQAHLIKAKREDKIAKIADAYFMLAYSTTSRDESTIYLDSVISITKDDINFKQPASAHIIKANDLGSLGRYKEAFIELDRANFCANTSGNTEQLYTIKYLIARLKTDVGDYESSSEILKDVILHFEIENDIRGRVLALWAYAKNLNALKKPDSATTIIKKAIPLSFKTFDSVVYDRLLLSSAISNYQKKDYKPSLDSIIKLNGINRKKLNYDIGTNVLMHLYKGKIYLEEDKDELTIKELEKVNSISFAKAYFNVSIRENYELLINYYKEKKETENQLYYIDKLLEIDSILDKRFAFLTLSINKKYTTPNLLLEKEKIIESLRKNDSNREISLVILSSFCVLLLLALFRNYRKKKTDKKSIHKSIARKSERGYIIDRETTKRILDGLLKVEKSDLFLNKDFNLTFLAKTLHTNTSYISKIINEHKQKTFKQYLIDLRISFLIKKLEENPIIRKHSIEALAESVGYVNASSFTRIFKNYTGVSPSEYLKKNYP